MKTCLTIAVLVACGFLGLTSFAAAQPAHKLNDSYEVQGQVLVTGQVMKIGDDFGVRVGAMHFVLDNYSRTDGRLLDNNMNKGVTVKGMLRTKIMEGKLVIVIDRDEPFKFGVDGFKDAKAEGDVQIRGLLTRDLPHHGDYRIPHDMQPGAFLLNRVSTHQFSPLHFSPMAAKKADGLYGCNVTLHCRFELIAPGSRSECLIFTAHDIAKAAK